MESPYRTFAFAAIALLLTGCVQQKPVYENPGFDEIDPYFYAANNTTVNGTVDFVNDTVAEVLEQPPSGWFDKSKKVGLSAFKILDSAVKGLFGDNAWFLVGGAVLFIVVLSLFKQWGMVVLFVVLMWILTKVV